MQSWQRVVSIKDCPLDRQFLFQSANWPKVHIKIDGTQQSLRKELAVVNRQYYRVLWMKIVYVQ